jgi:predicted ATP-grasp superfamily ATP-dependent carboligase
MAVIVTYARNRIALTITKSLAKKGIRVIASDNISPAMSCFSRYSSGHFTYPSPMRYPDEFVGELIRQAKKHEVQVIIPVHEESYILARYTDLLKKEGLRVVLKDYETLIEIQNKRTCTATAQRLGIPVPQTWSPNNMDEVARIAQEASCPLVIKLRRGRGAMGVKYVYSASDLTEQFNKVVGEFDLERENYPLIQEYIPGDGVGVSMLFDKGQPLAKFTHLRLKEFPVTGGTSVERISIRLPEAEDYAERLLRHFNWHGVAMVEFKIHSKSHKPYLLEVNPRFWGSLNQAICAGVDFPYLLYKIAMGEPTGEIDDYKLGVRTIWFYGYLRALPGYLMTSRRWQALGGLLNFFRKDTHFDDLSLRDPCPTVVAPIFALKQLVTKRRLTFETDEELVKNAPF